MAASVNDKFSKVSTGVRPTTTTVASIRSVAGTSLICDDLTGWDTDAAVHFVTYQVDGQGDVVAGTQIDMKGTVSSNTISNIVVTGGTDTGNAVGDIVQQLPTARYAKDLADGLLVAHDQDGTLKDNAVVTANITDEAVTTAKIDDGAVTAAKLSDTGWITASINTTLFATYATGTDIKYRRKGGLVEIVGAAKLTSAGVTSVGASAEPGFTRLMTLPAGFAPTSASYEQHTLAQSSGLSMANWAIKPNGEVGIERIVGTINTTNWLPVNLKCNAS